MVHISSTPQSARTTPIIIPPNKDDTTNNRQIKLPNKPQITTKSIIRIVPVGVDRTPKVTILWLDDESDKETRNTSSNSISNKNNNDSDSDASTRAVPKLIYRINCDEDDEEYDSDNKQAKLAFIPRFFSQ